MLKIKDRELENINGGKFDYYPGMINCIRCKTLFNKEDALISHIVREKCDGLSTRYFHMCPFCYAWNEFVSIDVNEIFNEMFKNIRT